MVQTDLRPGLSSGRDPRPRPSATKATTTHQRAACLHSHGLPRNKGEGSGQGVWDFGGHRDGTYHCSTPAATEARMVRQPEEISQVSGWRGGDKFTRSGGLNMTSGHACRGRGKNFE